MSTHESGNRPEGLKRLELLILIVIVELLVVIVLMGFMTSIVVERRKTADEASQKAQAKLIVESDRLSSEHEEFLKQNTANTNARALATAVQAEAITSGKYDTVLSDYATEMGGAIPLNPCTETKTGYTITTTGTTATVSAQRGSNCGDWSPMMFSLTL